MVPLEMTCYIQVSMQRPHIQTVVFNGFPQSLQANAGVMVYILKSNPPSYSFRGLKNQMRIRIACRLDSRSWAGFWKNDTSCCTCRKNNTIQYNNLLFYLLFIILYMTFIIYYSSDSPSSLVTESLSVTQSLSSAAVRLYSLQLNGHFTHGALVG